MKKIIMAGFIVAVCLLIIPLSLTKIKKPTAKQTSASVEIKADTQLPGITKDQKQDNSITFRIKSGDKILNLTADEYITGVVSAEMPTSFEAEALKAQCVAAYSFALYRRNARKGEQYDLTDSYKTDQSYLSDTALKEKWGDAYDEKISKIKQALSAVTGEYLSFNGTVALTLYHSVSSGKTNECKDVFGGDYPYLVSVDSQEDTLSPDYKSVFSFSSDELNRKLSSIMQTDGENLLSDIKTAKSGLVKEIKFAGTAVSGSKISGLLGLPSATFTVEYTSGAYTFTCLGRGHGVGMSQYGAQQLALTGSNYREILSHYYPGTRLEKP